MLSDMCRGQRFVPQLGTNVRRRQYCGKVSVHFLHSILRASLESLASLRPGRVGVRGHEPCTLHIVRHSQCAPIHRPLCRRMWLSGLGQFCKGGAQGEQLILKVHPLMPPSPTCSQHLASGCMPSFRQRMHAFFHQLLKDFERAAGHKVARKQGKGQESILLPGVSICRCQEVLLVMSRHVRIRGQSVARRPALPCGEQASKEGPGRDGQQLQHKIRRPEDDLKHQGVVPTLALQVCLFPRPGRFPTLVEPLTLAPSPCMHVIVCEPHRVVAFLPPLPIPLPGRRPLLCHPERSACAGLVLHL